MASVTFKRGTKAEIESTQIQDGQLLMETDQLNNNKIYLDLPNGTRVPVGGSGAWVGTKKEFEVAVEEGKIADGTQVIITDDYESGITASMTLYSNAQSGLVATNVQSAIDEVSAKIGQENISQVGNSVTGAINNLNSNLEYFVDMKNNNNIFKFTDTYSLQINCPNGYGAMTIYGFMQNYGSFIVHVVCTTGNASLIDVVNQASGVGFLKIRWDSNTKKLHIYCESTERPFAGVAIGMLV